MQAERFRKGALLLSALGNWDGLTAALFKQLRTSAQTDLTGTASPRMLIH